MNQDHQKDQDHNKDTTVFVNGRPKTTSAKELSFNDVVVLSGLPTGPDIIMTVTYTKGDNEKPQGTLVEGGRPVKVKEGMIFNVTPTNRS